MSDKITRANLRKLGRAIVCLEKYFTENCVIYRESFGEYDIILSGSKLEKECYDNIIKIGNTLFELIAKHFHWAETLGLEPIYDPIPLCALMRAPYIAVNSHLLRQTAPK